MSNASVTIDMASLVPLARRFWAGEAGQALHRAERACLGPHAERWVGVHGLEMSLGESIVDMSRVRHVMRWAPTRELAESSSTIVCRPDHLPLPNGALDLVVVHHMLEVVDCPHQLLQEVARVISGEGRLIILGWSPLSAGGLARFRPGGRQTMPGIGHWRSVRRMRDWLSFVEFEIERLDYCGFHLPGMIPHNALLETLGRRYNLPLGACWIIQARCRSRLACHQPQRPLFGAALGVSRLGISRAPHSVEIGLKKVGLERAGSATTESATTELAATGWRRSGEQQ